jgi:hypothetical protein
MIENITPKEDNTPTKISMNVETFWNIYSDLIGLEKFFVRVVDNKLIDDSHDEYEDSKRFLYSITNTINNLQGIVEYIKSK